MAKFESGYKSILAAKLTSDATTMSVATAPTVTSGRLYLNNGAQEEWIEYTGITGTTLTGLVRGLSKTADPATAGTGKSWIAGTPIKLVQMHDQMRDESETETITGDKTFTGDNTHNGTETFNGTVNMGALGDLNVLGTSNPQPNFANTTLRDALYTSPLDGDKCTVAGATQTYNGYTAQWENFGVSTPVPLATDTVYGIATLSQSRGVFDKTYRPGEAITVGKTVFVEDEIAFAAADQSQNICDVAANTRISRPIIGSGVLGTTLNLSLAKVGTPTENLNIRIETDNAGLPSGILADANATATIAPGDLTTSLADTEIAIGENVDQSTGITYDVSGSVTYKTGYKVSFDKESQINTVVKDSSCTATTCYLINSSKVVLDTQTFSTDTATFNYIVDAGDYYVMVDKGGASYTSESKATVSFPIDNAVCDYEAGITITEVVDFATLSSSIPIGTSGTFRISFTPIVDCYLNSLNNSYYNGGNATLFNGATLLETATGQTFSGTTLLSAGILYYIFVSHSNSTSYNLTGQTSTNVTINDCRITSGAGATTFPSALSINTETIIENTNGYNIDKINVVDGIVLTEGEKYHEVVFQGTYGSETIDDTNYYIIGYDVLNTTIRGKISYNGSAWNDLSSDIVSYYKLDGDSTDSAGSNDGTDTAITYGTDYGKINQGALFNGSSSKISIASTTALNIGGNFTVSLWFNNTALTGAGVAWNMLGKANPSTNGWMVYQDNSNKMSFYGYGLTTNNYVISTTVMTTGVWYHMVVTYDGSNLILYVNSVSEDNNAAGGTITANSDNLEIGYYKTTNTYYNGKIDEVGIRDRALTSDEVVALYNSGIGNQYPFTIITTRNPFKRIYTSSDLFTDKLLSLTDATYSYKVDRLGISNDTVSIGTKPNIIMDGISDKQSGMTYGDTMYLSDTPGAIQDSAGTESTVVGRAVSETKLMLQNTFNR